MTLHTPSTALSDTGPQRLPFATAEALLWGPELRKQHEWLLVEMRTLQAQHEAYHARIQTTEAVAEAAEAATSRIRHMEQQIAAMEAVDNDKVFENWAAGEIAELKIFADKNRTVRQKQVELEKEVANVADHVNNAKHVSTDFRSLERRLDLLEAGRMQDANQIKALEKEIVSLTVLRQKPVVNNVNSRADVDRKQSSSRLKTLPRVPGPDHSDATTETEDEDAIPPRKPAKEQIQVPQSPENRLTSLESVSGASSTKAPPAVSARLKLMKRPSIHNSKISPAVKERQSRAPAPEPEPHPLRMPEPPATQRVLRRSPRKQQQPDNDQDTQPVTRLQPKTEEIDSEQAKAPAQSKNMFIEPTQIINRSQAKRRKLNAAPSLSKKTPVEPTQPVPTSSTKRKKPNVAPIPSISAPAAPTQLVATSLTRRKQPNVVPPPGLVEPQVEYGYDDDLQRSTADVVKTLPRKAAMASPYRTRLSCDACHRLKTKCDHARPSCGQCVKRSQGHACQYVQPFIEDTQIVAPMPSSPQKKISRPNAPVSLNRPGANIDADQDYVGSLSRTRSPEKFAVSEQSIITGPPSSIAELSTATGSAERMTYAKHHKLRHLREDESGP